MSPRPCVASLTRTLAIVLMLLEGTTSAQSWLEPAVSQYDAADYDGALAALENASTAAVSTSDRVALDHYRVLCLLALGRTADAQAATGRLFTLHPGYTLAADSSPRVQALFDEVRARVLPDLIRGRYTDAKAQFDQRRLREAATGFAVVTDLGQVARTAGLITPALDDLLQLAAGFAQLARSMNDLESAEAPQAAGDGGEAGAQAPAEQPATTTTAPPPSGPVEYGPGDAGVVPPVALSQAVSAWHRSVPRPRTGAPLGTVEVLVDESGAVVSARVLSSVSAFYDAVLLESAKTWRYRPALKDGRPVRFRRAFAMVAGS